MTEQKAFSPAAEIPVALKRAGKSARVRFPKDEEWIRRHQSLRIVITRLAGGASETNIEGQDEANLALFNTIKLSGDDFDEAEASLCIERLALADSGEPVRDGDCLVIPIKAFGGIETEHRLRIPTEKEVRKHRRAAFGIIDLRHGKQQIRTNLALVGEFYDLLAQGSKDVPIIHKHAAVTELLATLDAIEEDGDPFAV